MLSYESSETLEVQETEKKASRIRRPYCKYCKFHDKVAAYVDFPLLNRQNLQSLPSLKFSLYS